MKTSFYLVIVALFLSFSLNSCVATVRTRPAGVVVVHKLPRAHKVVFVNGHRYYKWNGNYYRKTPSGYIVVRL